MCETSFRDAQGREWGEEERDRHVDECCRGVGGRGGSGGGGGGAGGEGEGDVGRSVGGGGRETKKVREYVGAFFFLVPFSPTLAPNRGEKPVLTFRSCRAVFTADAKTVPRDSNGDLLEVRSSTLPPLPSKLTPHPLPPSHRGSA